MIDDRFKVRKASKRASETHEQTLHRQELNWTHMASMRALHSKKQMTFQNISQGHRQMPIMKRRVQKWWFWEMESTSFLYSVRAKWFTVRVTDAPLSHTLFMNVTAVNVYSVHRLAVSTKRHYLDRPRYIYKALILELEVNWIRLPERQFFSVSLHFHPLVSFSFVNGGKRS